MKWLVLVPALLGGNNDDCFRFWFKRSRGLHLLFCPTCPGATARLVGVRSGRVVPLEESEAFVRGLTMVDGGLGSDWLTGLFGTTILRGMSSIPRVPLAVCGKTANDDLGKERRR